MRSRSLCLTGAALLAAAVAIATSGAAVAGETRGPAFGANKYVTSIANEPGESDVDDYVAALTKGDRITVQITPSKGSSLVPQVEVIGPDGAMRPVVPTVGRDGRTLAVKNLLADETGEWTVRVTGLGASQGEYTIAFRTTAGAAPAKRKVAIPATTESVFPFDAVDGATADITVTWKKGATPVDIVALTDPSGADALTRTKDVPLVVTKATSATIRGLVLHEGHGTYALRIAGHGGLPAACSVSVKLKAPPRPASAKPVRLPDTEPCIAAVATPIDGVAGYPVRLTGQRLTSDVRIFFGDRESTNVQYMFGAMEIIATPPAGTPGDVVDVSAVAPDGQACVRHDAFRYVKAPVFASFAKLDGSDAPGWSTGGGLALRISGAEFRAGQVVRFPGNVVATPTIVSPTELIVTTPAAPAGTGFLYVVDEWGQLGRSAETFEQKIPPTFSASAYLPSAAAVQTETTVSIRGSGFAPQDTLLLGGDPFDSVFVSPTERRFTLPALDAGRVTIAIRDRYGVTTAGPDFRVKSAPTVTSVVYVSGPRYAGLDLPIRGGTRLLVTGTEFDGGDVVTLGGTPVTRLSAGDTSFEFIVPPGAPGDATLALTDALGSVAEFEGVRLVGLLDVTSDAMPRPSSTDDFGGASLVLGDLDGDLAPDLIVGSPAGSAPGSRDVLTRVLMNDGSGGFADRTASAMPAAGSDSTGADDWNAADLALGDLDGDGDLDLAVVGAAPSGSDASGVRLFANDGSGAFSLDEQASPLSSAHGIVYAYDQYGYSHAAISARDGAGDNTAVAIGDVDGDDVPDVIVGRDRFEFDTKLLSDRYTQWDRDPPFIYSWYVNYAGVSENRFFSATRIYVNDLAGTGSFVERTDDMLPGPADNSGAPALVARDVVLADLDGDGDLDLVLAWDDPTTVTVTGLRDGGASASIATRILMNDGSGRFTDRTSTWMPAASGDEYFQADRAAAADLDDDGDTDLVLVASQGFDAWKGSATHAAPAMRVLRNVGGRFTKLASAIPETDGVDYRGRGLAIADVDGDGALDIVVGTEDSLSDGSAAISSTRVLYQSAPMTFTESEIFAPAATDDTGEAAAIVAGDVTGNGTSIVIVAPAEPAESANRALLRRYDWQR